MSASFGVSSNLKTFLLELPHHHLAIDEVFGTAQTDKSNFIHEIFETTEDTEAETRPSGRVPIQSTVAERAPSLTVGFLPSLVYFALCPLWLIILPPLFNSRQQTLNLTSFRLRQLLFPKPDSIVRVRNVSRFVHAGGGGKLQRRLVQLALDALLFQGL